MIYFSNSGYSGVTLSEAIDAMDQAGIRHVELSVGTKMSENTPEMLDGYIQKGFSFIPHHNSPINGKNNYMNLCDKVPTEYLKQVFEFCNKTGCKHYSVHGGHYNANIISKADAYDIFYKNLMEAYVLAARYGVLLSVETMYPTLNGDKYVLDDEESIADFRRNYPFVGVVMDAAHIKIQKCQGMSSDRIIRLLIEDRRLTELHLSENDGKHDRHTQVERNSWFWGAVRSRQDVPIVVEGKLRTRDIQHLKDNYEMVQEMLR